MYYIVFHILYIFYVCDISVCVCSYVCIVFHVYLCTYYIVCVVYPSCMTYVYVSIGYVYVCVVGRHPFAPKL